MSLHYKVDILNDEINNLQNKINILNKSKLDHNSLILKFNLKLLELKDKIQIIDNVKDSQGYYKTYQLNELVIISDFKGSDKHNKILIKRNINKGDIISIDEIGFNGKMRFHINGYILDNHVDITIDRLYSDKIIILNK